MSRLDNSQIFQDVHDSANHALKTLNNGGMLVPESFSSYTLSYIGAGNGVGEVGQINYYSGATLIASIVIAYNVDNKPISFTRT